MCVSKTSLIEVVNYSSAKNIVNYQLFQKVFLYSIDEKGVPWINIVLFLCGATLLLLENLKTYSQDCAFHVFPSFGFISHHNKNNIN
jgi:hypothetical protein